MVEPSQSELDAIMQEAKERSISVSSLTYKRVKDVISCNSSNPPSVGLEPDGGILLEWYKPSVSGDIFSLIVKDNALIWSHLGEDNVLGCHGVIKFLRILDRNIQKAVPMAIAITATGITNIVIKNDSHIQPSLFTRSKKINVTNVELIATSLMHCLVS